MDNWTVTRQWLPPTCGHLLQCVQPPTTCVDTLSFFLLPHLHPSSHKTFLRSVAIVCGNLCGNYLVCLQGKMGGREDDDYPDEMEERLINDEYKVWQYCKHFASILQRWQVQQPASSLPSRLIMLVLFPTDLEEKHPIPVRYEYMPFIHAAYRRLQSMCNLHHTDLVIAHALEWPSLTVQWLPVCCMHRVLATGHTHS